MIKLYNKVSNSDGGNKNGTEVNEGNKVSFILNSSENQEDTQPLGIRCDDGFKTVSPVIISLENTSREKWALSKDGQAWGEWGASLTLEDEISDVNTIIYIKAKATQAEGAKIDTSCEIRIQTTIGATV